MKEALFIFLRTTVLTASSAQAASGSEPAPEPFAVRGITLRSAAVGVGIVILVNLWVVYAETIVRCTRLNLQTLQLTLLSLFVLLVGFVNPLLKLIHRRLSFSSSELLVVVAIGMVGSVVPTTGVSGFLLGVISSPFYFDTPENMWGEFYHPYLSTWAVQTDREALRAFYEGLPPGADVPWASWIVPLAWWASIIAAIFVGSACAMVILRKSWVEHERLAYPLATVPMEMTRGADSGRLLPEFMQGRLFWIGALVPLSLFFWNTMHWLYPPLPHFIFYPPPHFDYFRFTRYSPFIVVQPLQFYTIGICYFANLQVLFSVWFFFLVHVVEGGIKNRLGYRIGWSTDSFSADPPTEAWQCHGALGFLVIWRLWVARHHLRDVFLRAVRSAHPADDRGEMLSYRVACFGLLLSLCYAVFWLNRIGMDAVTVGMFLFAGGIIYLGMARISAEAGVPAAQSSVSPQAFVMDLRGTDVMSRANLTGILLSYSLIDYMRGLFMPSLAHAARWGHTIRGSRRQLLLWVGIGVLAGLGTSVLFTIHLGHNYGAYNFSGLFFGGNPKQVFSSTLGLMRSPVAPDPMRLLFYGIGAGLMALLIFMRNRFAWWTLHPIGLVLSAADNNASLVMPVFIAWALKTILMRVGGVTLYRRTKPLFLGLLVGYTFGVTWSFVVDAIWFPGHGHAVSGW